MRNRLFRGILPGKGIPSEDALRQASFDALRVRLPSSWDLREVGRARQVHTLPRARWELRAPDGAIATLSIAVRRRMEPNGVTSALESLRSSDPTGRLFMVASFLSPRTREILAAVDAGYMDATGNMRLHVDEPAVFIDIRGEDTDPWRERRPLVTLKGPAAGRAVRALCDFRPPYGTLDIAERGHTPPSTMSRVIALLDREALLIRAGRGTITTVDWSRLIERWAQDYTFTHSNQITTYLEPRGLPTLLKKLRDAQWTYAVTGSLATQSITYYAAARLATVYVEDPSRAAASLALRPVDTGANVLLAVPFDQVVFDRTTKDTGVTYAALSQVAADLLTSPGRGPAEGKELLRWMEEHQDAWRN